MKRRHESQVLFSLILLHFFFGLIKINVMGWDDVRKRTNDWYIFKWSQLEVVNWSNLTHWCIQRKCKIEFNFHGEFVCVSGVFVVFIQFQSEVIRHEVLPQTMNDLNCDFNLLLWFVLLVVHKLNYCFDASNRTPLPQLKISIVIYIHVNV